MGNDTDRLAQMEDNFNAGDSVYEALGLQMQTQRDLAKFIEQEHQNDKYRQTLEYYLDEGYPQELAEELASAEVKVDEEL